MKLLLAALSCSVALTLRAQDFSASETFDFMTPLRQTTRFGISPFVGFCFGGQVEDLTTGNEYRFANGAAFGLCLDYAPLEYPGRFELLWSHQDSSIDFEGDNGLEEVDLTIDVIQVGGVAEFGTQRLRGYVSAHLGATHYSFKDQADTTYFSFGIGAGVKAYLTKNFYLRGDIRGFASVVEAEGSFIFYNGITIASFSGSTLWHGQVSAGVGFTF